MNAPVRDAQGVTRREALLSGAKAVAAATTGNNPLGLATLAPSFAHHKGETALPDIPPETASILATLYGKRGLLEQLLSEFEIGAGNLAEVSPDAREHEVEMFLRRSASAWKAYVRQAQTMLPLVATEPVQTNLWQFSELSRRGSVAYLSGDTATYHQLSKERVIAFRRLCRFFGDPDSEDIQSVVDDLYSEVQICGFGIDVRSVCLRFVDFHAELAVNCAISTERLPLPEELVKRIRAELRRNLSAVDEVSVGERAAQEVEARSETPGNLHTRYDLLRCLYTPEGFRSEFPRGLERYPDKSSIGE